MRLTVYSDYSLRVLMFLALKEENRSTREEISETYDISKEHLRKIIHQLSQENFITSVRGRTGGLYLAQPPNQINIGNVIRKTEGDFDIVECFNDQNNHCILKECCKLKNILNEALLAFLEVLDQYTLEDLLASRSSLRKSLGFDNSELSA